METNVTQVIQNVFAIWDLSSNETRISLQGLAKRPPEGFRISFADPGKLGGDLLNDFLIPGIYSADRVLVVAPLDWSAMPAIGFEIGLAIGLGKPIAVVTARPSLRFHGLSHAITKILDTTIPWWEMPPLDRDVLTNPDAWLALSLLPYQPLGINLALCPKSGIGKELREELKAQGRNRIIANQRSPKFLSKLASASHLDWVVTNDWEDDELGLAAGIFFAWNLQSPETWESPSLRVLRSQLAPAIRSLQSFTTTFEDLEDFSLLLRSEPHQNSAGPAPLVVEGIEIRNFKNIEHLKLDLSEPSSLEGEWTCIAGVNGAGKSSILQALCMLLLGERQVAELGSERIKRTLRRVGTDRLDAELTAFVRAGRDRLRLFLPLSKDGVDRRKLYADKGYSEMLGVWDRLGSQVLVSYGASRNLSDHKDTRYASLGAQVRRQMTLFDSLTQIASIDVLLDGGPPSVPILRTLRRLLEAVLTEELAASNGADRLIFSQCGAEVEAIDLPDGFRSTVAWLADLCATWHETAPPEETQDSDPSKIRGIVLLDEIDLHLHPSLQRALVPRLRKALPNVQFIVTTHSPLVLSSFDRTELVVLDRHAEGGVRELDRQIFAFSTDQVYEWLMGTPPQSTVIEEKLKTGDDPNLGLYLYQSEGANEDEARAQLDERQRLIEELRGSLKS
jgi:predicted ATPase